MATTVLKTVITAIGGGTASWLGGGKFANGAFSGAFVYLFNHAIADYILKQKRGRYNIMDELADKAAIDNGLSREEARVKAAKAYGTMGLALLSAPIALEGGAIELGVTGYRYAMANPEVMIGGADIAIGYFDGNPPSNGIQAIGLFYNKYNEWSINSYLKKSNYYKGN